MSSKVNIVMSAYNGEKYIRKQLDSLLEQKYKNIEIYVRDDCSTDATLQILNEYKEKYGIHVLTGKNLGFAASFFEVMRYAEDGDYWAFCDQDDIWFPDKILRAVKYLDKMDQKKPLLYYSLSSMFAGDDEDHSIGVQKPPKGSLCFRRAMTGTFGVGFSMVINKRLRDEMLKCDPYKVHSHDWLAGAIALGFGKIKIDNKICAGYRRLDTSVTKITFSKRMKWFFSSLKKDGDVRERNREYYRVYKDQLDEENLSWAKSFGEEKLTWRMQMKKVLCLKRWRPSVSSEIVMRFLMLKGKI